MANKKVANYNIRFINFIQIGGDPRVDITPAELFSNDKNMLYILVQPSGETVYYFYSASVRLGDPTADYEQAADFMIQMSDGISSIKGNVAAGDNWFNEWMIFEVSD